MIKQSMRCLWVMGAVMTFCGLSLAEEVQITTYYPSPVGNYQKITAGSVVISGNDAIAAGLLLLQGTTGVTINSTNDPLTLNAGSNNVVITANNLNLLASGRMGIGGSADASRKLQVTGDAGVTGRLTTGSFTMTGTPSAGEAIVTDGSGGKAKWGLPRAVYS